MIRVPLRARNGSVRAHALIDDEDAHLAALQWSLHSKGYAQRNDGPKGGRYIVLLHREVLGLTHGDGLKTDHENGDRLDCRRSNLRIATTAQNGQNIAQSPGRSMHRGVTFEAGRWRARAMLNGRYNHLGRFDTEEEAAAAARAFRAEHMPFANEERHACTA